MDIPQAADTVVNPTRNEVMVVYDDPLQCDSKDLPNNDYCYLFEQRSSRSAQDCNNSYKKALDARYETNMKEKKNTSGDSAGTKANITQRCNAKDYAGQRSTYRRHAGTMARSSSLSHLLIGPRVETAFVGDDAFTVYHGSRRRSELSDYLLMFYCVIEMLSSL